MRLYLSSFRLGQHHEHLLRLAGNGRRTALVPNTLDNIPAQDRSEGLRRDRAELEAAGLTVEMLDLRQHDAIASRYTEQGQQHWALSDGQVLLVEGDRATVL